MEFIEAPAFTRYLANYLDDDRYKELQAKLGQIRIWEIGCRARADFGRCAGRTLGEAKAAEVGCALSIITSTPIARFG
jgi:hypothetical protein